MISVQSRLDALSENWKLKNLGNTKPSEKLRPLEVVSRNNLRTTTSGGHSREEPPGPIPNPEVKLLSADGSGTIGPVRVGRRQL